MDQSIRFCTSSDGAKLAYAVTGDGPPLVMSATWLTHLEHQWRSLAWKHGLNAPPEIQRYGCARHETKDGYISVTDKRTGSEFYFNDFVGRPAHAEPPFNLVRASDHIGNDVELPYEPWLEFAWHRP